MDKKQFMSELEKNLKGISGVDRKEIISDYEEHFAIGKSKRRKEEDIAKSLGNPKQLAKQARIELLVSKAEDEKSVGNIFRIIFATLSLSFFNLIFVVGIFFALLAVVISLFATGFAIVISGLAVFLAGIISPFFNVIYLFGSLAPIIIILAGIGLMAFGALFTIGTKYVAQAFYIITIKYVKLNMKIIRGKQNEK